MSFIVPYGAAEYIQRLAGMVRIAEGKAEFIPRDEKSGQRTMDFANEGGAPRFLINVDLVIEGGCAEYHLMNPVPSVAFPLGQCMKEAGKENQPAKSWLHTVLKRHEPQSVLFIPGCCNQYAEVHQRIIREAFPAIGMHFPQLQRDYCDCLHRHLDELVNELIRENVIGGK